jgi:DNA-binding response OmpR family regulator
VTVLIVDDEHADAEAASSALESAGFSIVTADSYDAAIAAFEKRIDISMALLDVSLPGKNGVDLALELLKRRPELKILFVSGHVGAEVIRFYGLQATDRHFLKKPFEVPQLISRVEEVMNLAERLRLDPTSSGPKKVRGAGGTLSADAV